MLFITPRCVGRDFEKEGRGRGCAIVWGGLLEFYQQPLEKKQTKRRGVIPNGEEGVLVLFCPGIRDFQDHV